MATKIFRGDAQVVRQVTTITPANVEIDDVFRIIINQKEIEFTATAATAANVTAGLAAAWSASLEPETGEITATDDTTHVTLTGPTDGRPFTVTTSHTDGGGANTQTLTASTVAGTGTGPEYWDNADNWSPSGVPANGDDVILQDCPVSIKYGLAQSAVQLASFRQFSTFTGDVGLPSYNQLGYFEYRETELAIGATEFELGIGDGSGSGRIRLNTGTGQTTGIIRNAGASPERGLPAILWRGTHAANAINITKGTLGIAWIKGHVATVQTLRIGFETNEAGDAEVRCGSGVTHTNVVQSGGFLETNSAITSFIGTAGEWVHRDGVVTTMDCDRGSIRYLSDGTCTTARIGSDGELDLRKDTRPVTITNLELHAGCAFRDPQGRGTYTNGIDFYRCSPADVTLELPPHRNYVISAV
jgi:hypothetical protein